MQGFQLLSQYSSTYTSSHFRSGFSTFKSFGLQVFHSFISFIFWVCYQIMQMILLIFTILQISLQFLGSWKIRTQAQKLRPARWVLAPMRSATSWEQMVRRKNTVPKCLNPKMPNAKYMSIYLLYKSINVTKSNFIQHKRGPSSVLLKLLDHVSLMSINTPGTTTSFSFKCSNPKVASFGLCKWFAFTSKILYNQPYRASDLCSLTNSTFVAIENGSENPNDLFFHPQNSTHLPPVLIFKDLASHWITDSRWTGEDAIFSLFFKTSRCFCGLSCQQKHL